MAVGNMVGIDVQALMATAANPKNMIKRLQ